MLREEPGGGVEDVVKRQTDKSKITVWRWSVVDTNYRAPQEGRQGGCGVVDRGGGGREGGVVL